MHWKIAYSTCPNDTFMFEAMVHDRIRTDGHRFSVVLDDIENLNQYASTESPDLCKISYAFYPFISRNYQILSAGSALGYGNGPLLVSRHKIYPDEVRDLCVLIPGEKTTANALLSIFFPDIREKKKRLFSEIEERILSGEADAGVLIHETRFTYSTKGLQLISDLGSLWENNTGLPIPLGAIAVKRALPPQEKSAINKLMRESIVHALAHPSDPMDYVRKHAQITEESIFRKHIELYVNDFSVNLSESGKTAAFSLFTRGEKAGLFPSCFSPVFID